MALALRRVEKRIAERHGGKTVKEVLKDYLVEHGHKDKVESRMLSETDTCTWEYDWEAVSAASYTERVPATADCTTGCQADLASSMESNFDATYGLLGASMPAGMPASAVMCWVCWRMESDPASMPCRQATHDGYMTVT